MPRKDEKRITDMDAYLREQAEIQRKLIEEMKKNNPSIVEKKVDVSPERIAEINARFKRAFEKGVKQGLSAQKNNAALTPEQRLDSIEKSFKVVPNNRLRPFFQLKGFASYTKLNLQEGFIRGIFELDYLSPALASIAALGEELGISDLMKGGSLCKKWNVEFAGFVPLAILSDEKGAFLHAFVVVDARKDDCPVYLWDEEGWSLYPLSDSLSGFLLAKPAQAKNFPNAHATNPYRAFSWKK